MNEINNSVLSNFVSINEQYARSARIDKDNIEQLASFIPLLSIYF